MVVYEKQWFTHYYRTNDYSNPASMLIHTLSLYENTGDGIDSTYH